MSHRPADHPAPMASLPLFQQGVGVPPQIQAPQGLGRLTPQQHGQAGASDTLKHLTDEAPAWLLQALGDALLACRDMPEGFSSDDVRRLAGPTVDVWLTAEKVRRNCFSGWMKSRAKLHRLIRVGTTPSKREDANGRHIAVWKFPS